MASDHYRISAPTPAPMKMYFAVYHCDGCDKDLELDFGTGTPWYIAGKPGAFHDKNQGTQQDDDDAGEPDLCGPMWEIVI